MGTTHPFLQEQDALFEMSMMQYISYMHTEFEGPICRKYILENEKRQALHGKVLI